MSFIQNIIDKLNRFHIPYVRINPDCFRFTIKGLDIFYYPLKKKGLLTIPTLYTDMHKIGFSKLILFITNNHILQEYISKHNKLSLKQKNARLKCYKWAKELLYRKSQNCYYCTSPLSFSDATVDHYIPLAKGGDNLFCNYRLACNLCNQMKGGMLPTPELMKRLRLNDVNRFFELIKS